MFPSILVSSHSKPIQLLFMLAVAWWTSVKGHLDQIALPPIATNKVNNNNTTDNNSTTQTPIPSEDTPKTKPNEPPKMSALTSMLWLVAVIIVLALIVLTVMCILYAWMHRKDQNERIRKREAYALDELRRERPPAPDGKLPTSGYKVHKKVPFSNAKLKKVPVPSEHALPSNPPVLGGNATEKHVTFDSKVDAFAISGREESEFLSERGYDRRRDPVKGIRIVSPSAEKLKKRKEDENYQPLQPEDIIFFEELFDMKYDHPELEYKMDSATMKSKDDEQEPELKTAIEFTKEEDSEDTTKSYHSPPVSGSEGSGMPAMSDKDTFSKDNTFHTYSRSPGQTSTKTQPKSDTDDTTTLTLEN